MTATYFVVFLVIMIILTIAMIARYLPGRTAVLAVGGLLTWLVYVRLMSYFGVVRNPTMRPPGVFLIVAPVLLFVAMVLVRSPLGAFAARAFPLWLILGLQVFRVGVELLLHRLWSDGVVPRLMTYEGGNFDIYIGLSAPIVAWIATRGRAGHMKSQRKTAAELSAPFRAVDCPGLELLGAGNAR